MKKENEKNKDIQRKYERELGSKDYLNSSIRDDLYKAGIVDENLIIKALKEKGKNSGMTDKDIIQSTLMANKMKSVKDAEDIEKQLKQVLEEKGAFADIDKKLEAQGAFKNMKVDLKDTFAEIDKDTGLTANEKRQAKRVEENNYKSRIIDREKNRIVHDKCKVSRKMAGLE